MPPQEMSTTTLPRPGTSTSASSSSRNDGGMSRVTRSHFPFEHLATALTRPAAVSIVTTVLGSFISIMPVSRRTVTRQMLLEPDMACALSPCRIVKAVSASGCTGGNRRFVLICVHPLGSFTRKRRSRSSTSFMYSSLSRMVSPGIDRTPPVTIRSDVSFGVCFHHREDLAPANLGFSADNARRTSDSAIAYIMTTVPFCRCTRPAHLF